MRILKNPSLRARILLKQFEAKDQSKPEPIMQLTTEQMDVTSKVEEQPVIEDEMQLSLFTLQDGPKISKQEQEVLETISRLNMLGTTPMQAMTVLYELQQKLLASK